MLRRLSCRLDPPYSVLIGDLHDPALRDELADLVRAEGWCPPAVLVSDERVAQLHARPVLDLLRRAGLEARLHTIPPGEESKSLATYAAVCGSLLRAGVSRRSPLVALGGGVVSDVAGFAAATFARGIPWICVPTTLLAQVDSSVGGKVGVNLPEAKNMLGAFHQPRGVLSDPALLRTLPEREYASGLAEVVKAALVGDPPLLDLLEERRMEIRRRDRVLLEEVIARAVAVKCAVVEEDEKDTGRRHVLNLGHTFGHALESATGYRRFLHGEAVAIGLVAALRVSARMGLLEDGAEGRVSELFLGWGLPTRAVGVDPEEVARAMGMDKKSTGGRPLLVLLEGYGKPRLVRDPPASLVLETIRRMLAGQEEGA